MEYARQRKVSQAGSAVEVDDETWSGYNDRLTLCPRSKVDFDTRHGWDLGRALSDCVPLIGLLMSLTGVCG